MATEAQRAADPASGEGRQWYVFFPVIFGVIRSPATEGDEISQPADRLVMVNPMMILRGGLGFPDPISMLQEILGADQRPDGPPPASKASVEALRMVDRAEAEAGKEGSEECAVCLDRMWNLEAEECEVVKEMPCGHRFHGGCIEKWLNLRGICPLCRHRMPEERDGGKKGREERGRQGDSEERRPNFTFNWTLDLGSILPRRQTEQQQQHYPIIDDLD